METWRDEVGSWCDGGRTPLRYRWFPAKDPTAVLVFLHGLAEHTGRLEHVASRLALRGLSCLTFDLRGHGEEGSGRHHSAYFADYLDDLDLVLGRLGELTGTPVRPFLVGHSLGGLVAVASVLDRRPDVAGVVLVSPALGFGVRPGSLRLLLGGLLHALAPRFPMASHMPLDRISRNPDVERLMRAENPRGVIVSPRWYFSCLRAQERVAARAADFGLPLLTLLASEDAIVDPEVAHRFHRAAGAPEADCVRFASCFHALFDEPERAAVLARLVGWIEARAARPA